MITRPRGHRRGDRRGLGIEPLDHGRAEFVAFSDYEARRGNPTTVA